MNSCVLIINTIENVENDIISRVCKQFKNLPIYVIKCNNEYDDKNINLYQILNDIKKLHKKIIIFFAIDDIWKNCNKSKNSQIFKFNGVEYDTYAIHKYCEKYFVLSVCVIDNFLTNNIFSKEIF